MMMFNFYQFYGLIQAITDEGEDPNEYIFEAEDKNKTTPVKRARNESRNESSNANEIQVIVTICTILTKFYN